jgi:hypothetical protein
LAHQESLLSSFRRQRQKQELKKSGNCAKETHKSTPSFSCVHKGANNTGLGRTRTFLAV